MFYNPRLDDAEAGLLYASYRSQEYQQMRYESEPWYTPRFNADLASSSSYDRRRRIVGEILRKYLGERKVSRVLDYGGDHGDLVLGLISGAVPFVYDISGVDPTQGVVSTSDPAGCKADLIINSNVLEHVGFPDRFMKEIVAVAPPGGLIFLEVPRESPFGVSRLARRVAQVGVMALARPNLARRVIRPASLYMMHEHINYFTEQSLACLMRSSGCAVTATGSYAFEGRAGSGGMVWCLGATAEPLATPPSV